MSIIQMKIFYSHDVFFFKSWPSPPGENTYILRCVIQVDITFFKKVIYIQSRNIFLINRIFPELKVRL